MHFFILHVSQLFSMYPCVFLEKASGPATNQELPTPECLPLGPVQMFLMFLGIIEELSHLSSHRTGHYIVKLTD